MQIWSMDQRRLSDTKMKTDSFGKRLKSFLKACSPISVEPVLFLILFASNLKAITNVTLIMEMVCSAEKNFSNQVCENFLHDEKYVQEKISIQKSANNWGIINTIVEVLPAVLIGMSAGPWSDKYGRKIPLLFPVFGAIISTVSLLTIVNINFKFSPDVVIFSNISSGITGGFLPLLIGFSYVADVSTNANRSMKFIFVEGFIMLGIPSGNLLGAYIHKLYGFGPVYILALICQILSLVYGILFLKETRGIGIRDSWKTRLKYFFNLKTFSESIKVCYRTRPGNKRTIVIFLLLSMLSYVFFINLENSIAYMYTQLAFNWNQWTFSVFKSATGYSSLIFTLTIAPVLTYILKISDIAIGIFGVISGISSVIIMGTVRKTAPFYFGGFVGIFQSLIPPLLRSCITKVVDPDETGKIFAFLTSLEFGTPILASLFYVQIYNHTVHFFPSLVYFIAGFIDIWPLITFIVMDRSNASELKNYQLLEESD